MRGSRISGPPVRDGRNIAQIEQRKPFSALLRTGLITGTIAVGEQNVGG